MRITKRKSNTKKIAITLIILAVLIAGAATAYYLYFLKSMPTPSESSQTINLEEPTKDQIEAGSERKMESIENDTKIGGETPKTEDISVILSSSEKDDTTYRFRYLIQETVSTGTCTLTLKKGSTSVTKTAQVQAFASSSTCRGFDVALTELSSGAWTATMKVTSGNRSGSVTSEFKV